MKFYGMSPKLDAAVIAIGAGICVAILLGLTGCAETGPHTSATDWRSIHQPSPTTPGGSDGHGN